MNSITAQSTPEQRLAAGDLMTASALASKANSSREVTTLFNTGNTRALDAPGTQTLDGHADYFQRPEKRSVLDAAAVRRMGTDGTLREFPQGDPGLPHAVLYSWRDLLDALGIAPPDDTATPTEDDEDQDDEDQDDEPGDVTSVEAAAEELGVPADTLHALVHDGRLPNRRPAPGPGSNPDIESRRPAQVSVQEARDILTHGLGVSLDRPDDADLMPVRKAAFMAGVDREDVQQAIRDGDLTDWSAHHPIRGHDGSVTLTTARALVSLPDVKALFQQP